MYKWDRDLLHRAVDLELEAMKVGRSIKFDFPYYGARGICINSVDMWEHGEDGSCKHKTACTNKALKSMLDRLEKELSQDGNHPGTKVSPNETLPHNYKEKEWESQAQRRMQG